MAYFLISDIHGCYNEFLKMLKEWNQEDTLVLMGDYIDRGPDSLKVLEKIMSLQKEHGDKVIALKGNHEDDFIQWLNYDNELASYLYLSRFKETIFSFYEHDKKKYKKASRRYKHSHINYKYKRIVRFLNQLPSYFDTPHCIFVHAGFDLEREDWKRSNRTDFFWLREEFFDNPKDAPKKTFFGHTPVSNFHDKAEPFQFSDNKVAIDGGCVFGGSLLGLRVEEDGCIINVHSIPLFEKK